MMRRALATGAVSIVVAILPMAAAVVRVPTDAAGLATVVQGRIRTKYAAMRYQRSCLGFPTTDEFRVSVGRRVRFEKGTITYYVRTRATRARCWR